MKASRTGVQKAKSEASRGRAKTGMLSARGAGLLLLIGVCAFVVLYFQRTFWAGSVDVAHHYALIAHMQASRQLPSPADRSLGEMSVYPRFAHILAAIAGTALGSPLT